MRKWELVDDALFIIDHLTNLAITMDRMDELEYLIQSLEDTCEFLDKDKMNERLKKRKKRRKNK